MLTAVAGIVGPEEKGTHVDVRETHRRAQEAFNSVLAAARPEQVDAPTPCTEWTVRDVVVHLVDGNCRMAGTGQPELPHDVDGLVEAHAESARAAQGAFSAPGGLERDYQFTSGTIAGGVAAGRRARDALAHAWDLAKATGQTTDLEPDLAAEILSFTIGEIPAEARGPGRRYAKPRPCPPDRPAADQLAAYLGRDTGWAPPPSSADVQR